MAQDLTHFSWKDFDNESARMTINTVEITAANLDAQATLITTLRTSMNNLTLAAVEQAVITDNVWDNVVVVTDPFAQREIKWTIIVRDTAGNQYKANEIPLADLSLLENASKYIIKGGSVAVSDPDGFVAAFKAAYEAVAVSNTGLALTIWDMYQSGRNN